MADRLTCPTCGWEHRAPLGPHVPSTPWSDDCACSDLLTCLRHQIDGRTIPDRPDGDTMLVRAKERYDHALIAWHERTEPLRNAAPALTTADVEALEGLLDDLCTWVTVRDHFASNHRRALDVLTRITRGAR